MKTATLYMCGIFKFFVCFCGMLCANVYGISIEVNCGTISHKLEHNFGLTQWYETKHTVCNLLFYGHGHILYSLKTHELFD